MTVKQKRDLIAKKRAEIENDRFRLQVLIKSSSSDTLKCRMDHLERTIEALRDLCRLEEMYAGCDDSDLIIVDIHEGDLITLNDSECRDLHRENRIYESIELQQAIKDEIELGEGDYYRERNR